MDIAKTGSCVGSGGILSGNRSIGISTTLSENGFGCDVPSARVNVVCAYTVIVTPGIVADAKVWSTEAFCCTEKVSALFTRGRCTMMPGVVT